MKKGIIEVEFDDEKMEAIRFYLSKKEQTLENEMQNIMKTLYEKMLVNYDFIIQISHLDEIKDWHNHIVTVTKTNNVSKINIIR